MGNLRLGRAETAYKTHRLGTLELRDRKRFVDIGRREINASVMPTRSLFRECNQLHGLLVTNIRPLQGSYKMPSDPQC
nr:hypothetical transcript [Hymenolepis microstoma]